MNILVGGDFFIDDAHQNSKLLSKEIRELFSSVDYRIVNLEGPLTNSNNKILKTGPHLKAKEETIIPFLKELDINLVTLSNNHILDYGEEGLKDTFTSLERNSINCTGAGKNTQDASSTFSIINGNLSIGIVNFSENEWAASTDNTYGANPMNIIDNTNQIIEAKKIHNYVICIIHGGHEYYNLPSPRMQKQYRFYADNGADLILGHHTHCISGYEIYNNVPIYYGIGNMLFTRNSLFTDWYFGIILEVIILNSSLNVKLHPVTQDRNTFFLRPSNLIDRENLLSRFNDYSQIIQVKDSLLANWNEYLIQQSSDYLGILSPRSFIKNKYLRAGLNRLGVTLNNPRGNSLLLNMLRCESHRDLSSEIVNKYLINTKFN